MANGLAPSSRKDRRSSKQNQTVVTQNWGNYQSIERRRHRNTQLSIGQTDGDRLDLVSFKSSPWICSEAIRIESADIYLIWAYYQKVKILPSDITINRPCTSGMTPSKVIRIESDKFRKTTGKFRTHWSLWKHKNY